MKLCKLVHHRHIQISKFLKHFSMEKSMLSTVNNPAQVCINEVKGSHVLKESVQNFDSKKSFPIPDVEESKVLLQKNSDNDGEETKSAILSEVFGEILKLKNEKNSGSCTYALEKRGACKTKRSDVSSLNETSSEDSQDASSARPFTVSIEGNIGSGKSTFLKHFAAMPLVATYQEPLGKWTDVGGYNLLGKLYEDPKRWSFLFQSYVQLTRLHIHLQKGEGASVKLIERSLQNNRYCFVESGHDSGDLQSSEYDVLCEYFDSFNENLDLGVDLIVYLRSSPEVVYQRMQQRARAEEAGVPLAYLQTLHTYYERWLMERKPCPPPAPVLVIDANSDLLSVTRCIGVHQRLILGQETFDGHIKGLENEQKENRDPLEDNLKNGKQKKFTNNTEKTDNSSSEIK